MHQQALDEVYWPRIHRRKDHYSVLKLGAFGADLAALAGLYREMGDYERAWGDLEEAKDIAERGEMKLHLTDYHLEAARLCGVEGKKEDARDHLEGARALIEETGYHQRDSEVEELG